MDPASAALNGRQLLASTVSAPAETIRHGGDLGYARAMFPGAPEPWIDLSTGINPHAYPLPPLAASAWTELPQTDELLKLARSAARRYAAPSAEMIVAAAGAQALIALLPHLVPASPVAVLAPTYVEHQAAWRRAGHDVRMVSQLSEARDARVVVVVNPNNPTGRIIPKNDLQSLAQAVQRRNGLLVVDEAFADPIEREVSLVPDLPPATIVLRSFGKIYGLPGLRLGFAIAHPELARRVREHLGPWPLSGAAIAVGSAALADDRWLDQALRTLDRDSQRLDHLLAASGCASVGGTPLFRLVSHAAAAEVAETLGHRGILVRRFEKEPSWLRFGLPGPEAAWQRVADALAAVRETT